MKFSRILTNPEEGTHGIFKSWGLHGSWEFVPYLWLAGGEVMVKDEKGNWRAVFDCEAAVEALLYFVRLNTERWTDAAGREHKGVTLHSGIDDLVWEEGRVGMRLMYMGEATIGWGI